MKFSKLSKILTVVLLVSVLAISLIACSTSKNNKDEKESIDSSISTLMATEPNSADEASKLHNQLMEKGNEILSTDTALWKKVFMASNKATPMIEDGTNYGDDLLKTIEGAKDQFTDEEYKKLVAGAEQIKEIEGKLTILEQKYPECANAPSNGDSVPADSNGVISNGGGATSFPSFDGKDLDGNDIKSSDFFKSNNVTTTEISTTSFHENSFPNAERIPSLTAESGNAPSSTPCGHIYLQKYGSPIPKSFTMSTGNKTTANSSTAYLIYVSGLSFFVENFLVGTLCNKSCNQPNGHKNPQIKRPSRTPNKMRNPVI